MVEQKELLASLLTQGHLDWNPEALVFHKPRGGNGNAAKFQLRVKANLTTSDAGSLFIDKKTLKGGLFVDIAAEDGFIERDGKKYAKFAWEEDAGAKRVTAKLCRPDISGLLVSLREMRHNPLRWVDGKIVPNVVPFFHQPKNEPDAAKAGRTFNAFHKFGKTINTAITYVFEPQGGILAISKSKEVRRSIAISLSEEVMLERFLQNALDVYVATGLR